MPRHPVIETFGPTIQGEGPDAGEPCYFVRFGGCDYRCEWCDSMYAVEPSEVKENSTKLTPQEIADRVRAPARCLVILSGGNPALHDLTELVALFRQRDLRTSVETQGSVWREWLGEVDRLVISPKPPSSGMVSLKHERQTRRFMEKAGTYMSAVLKVVVFDQDDYDWAHEFADAYPWLPLYLSVGTEMGTTETGAVRDQVCEGYAWLAERVAHDAWRQEVHVLPQLHVLAWGMARGV